jgi:2-haloacid dehalogenase
MNTQESRVEGIAFDIFGTTFDWFKGVVEAGTMLSSSVDWQNFAVSWMNGYRSRVEQVRLGQRPWAPLDMLLDETFAELKNSFNLQLDPAEIEQLRSVWHRLPLWPDVREALERLRTRFRIGGLSNANTLLLVDLARNSSIAWDCLISAEMPKKYKPEPEPYLLAAASLGSQPKQVLYVAAHKWDLQAGQAQGLATAFVPRPTELGTSQPAPEDPAPDPNFGWYGSDFNDLANKLLAA